MLKVFIWCLLKATHTDYTQLVGRQKVLLKPGQFVTGRPSAGAELNMPPSTAWEYLKLLEENETINIKSNNKFSIVTVVNWEFYQIGDKNSDNKSDNISTADQQQIDTNNNNNNVNNSNNNIISSEEGEEEELKEELRYGVDDINYKIALYLREQVFNVNPKNRRLPKPEPKHMQKWADEIRKLIQIDKMTKEDIHKVIKFVFSNSFWDTVIQSPSGLRKNWDTIYGQMMKSNSSRTSSAGSHNTKPSKIVNFKQPEIDYEELERKEQEHLNKMLEGDMGEPR